MSEITACLSTNQTWSMLPPMNTPRAFFGSAVVSMDKEKEVLIVAGGGNGSLSAEMFDLKTRQWEQLPPMITGRHSCASAAIGNQFFVIGGNNGNHRLSTVETFDLKTQKWTALPSTKRYACAAVAVGQTIIVIGGITDSGETSTVEQYNVEGKKWSSLPSSLPSMPTARYGCTAAVIDNKIYVVGGRNECHCLKTVECYDVESGEWKTLPSMINARYGCAAASMGKHLFVMGGIGLDKGLDSAEVFDVETEKWTMLPNMSNKRVGCAAAVMGNRVCVVGGYSKGGVPFSTCEELCVDKSKMTFVQKPKALMEQQALSVSSEKPKDLMGEQKLCVDKSKMKFIEKPKDLMEQQGLTLAQRVQRLEDAFGLGSISGQILKDKVYVFEFEFFGSMQKGDLMQRIERLESRFFPN